jgi:hypothetical protein
MNSVSQALQLMGIGLPVMFIVILLFIGAAVFLKKMFPYDSNEEKK